jgi:hypothetical protein
VTLEQWRGIIIARDNLMLACAAGTIAFVLNWYVFPRLHQLMVWIAVTGVIVSIAVRLYWR